MYCMHSLSSYFKEACSKPKENEIENSMFMLNMEFISLVTTRFSIFFSLVLFTHNRHHPIAIVSVSGELINSIFNVKTLNILYVFPIALSAGNIPPLSSN